MTTVFVYTRDFLLENKVDSILPFEVNKILEGISEEANKNKSLRSSSKKNYDTTWRKKKPQIKALQYKDELDKISKKININLNKLTESNFVSISNSIIELVNTEELLDILINAIFDKAIAQPTYCKLYVKFCNLICELDINTDNYIQNLLVNKCAEMIASFNIAQITNSDINNYDNFCEDLKKKLNKIGSVRFIGELYNFNLIDNSKIQNILEGLFNNIYSSLDKNIIELFADGIFSIMETIWDKLKDELPDLFKIYISKIEEISLNKEYIPKIRFKMMDIVDKYKKI